MEIRAFGEEAGIPAFSMRKPIIDAAGAGDMHEQVQHDVAFHRIIVEACGNSILRDVWVSLRIEVRTTITALRTGIDLDLAAAIHEPILEALRSRDPEAAGQAMRDHFHVLRQLLKEPRE